MAMLPSGLPEHVGDEEDLARFLTQSRHFNSIMVKPAAFLPNPQDRETSISRHGREPTQQLWEIGSVAAGERKLYGAAIFRAGAVRSARLDVVADEPPPRHAVISGWPWADDLELQKSEQRELAVLLANAAGEPLLR